MVVIHIFFLFWLAPFLRIIYQLLKYTQQSYHVSRLLQGYNYKKNRLDVFYTSIVKEKKTFVSLCLRHTYKQTFTRCYALRISLIFSCVQFIQCQNSPKPERTNNTYTPTHIFYHGEHQTKEE